MASDTLASRIQARYATEIAEIDREAASTAQAIVHQLNITLMSSADLNLTLNGHHLKAELHPHAEARLLTTITEIVRSKLSIQRSTGEREALSTTATSRSFLHQ